MEEVLHSLLLRTVAVDEVLGCSSKNDLSCNTNGGIFFEPDRRLLSFSIVENNCDAGFCDTSLTALIYQVLWLSSVCTKGGRIGGD